MTIDPPRTLFRNDFIPVDFLVGGVPPPREACAARYALRGMRREAESSGVRAPRPQYT